MLPPTVSTMQTPMKRAMRKLCQGLNAGSTGTSSVASGVELTKKSVELLGVEEELYHSTTLES